MFGKAFDLLVDLLMRAICKIDDSELVRVPDTGPYLLIFNHINFLEAPLFYLRLRPRPLYAIMKVELSRIPLMKGIAKRWGGIPLKRGAPPSAAFRKAGELFKEGALIALAPEGTRSHDGRLQQGNPGVVTMALQNDVAIIPVVHFGSQELGRNLKRFRRTPITMKVGRPFRFEEPDKLNKETRKQLTEKMMFQMARLMPESLRGVYSSAPEDAEEGLVFLDADNA